MTMDVLEIQQRLNNYRPRSCWWRSWGRQAAVALILRMGNAGLEVLMIRRAEHPADPWSGQMGFPGGRRESVDQDLLGTVYREVYEEIGLELARYARLVSPLSVLRARPWRWTRRPMTVSPYVFLLQDERPLIPNYEVAEVVWVPLAFLADTAKRQLFDLKRQGRWLRGLPCYDWQGRRIWGMSLSMLDELIFVLSLT